MNHNFKEKLELELRSLSNQDFFEWGNKFFSLLGYKSNRTFHVGTDRIEDFIDYFSLDSNYNFTECLKNISKIRFLFQFTDSEVSAAAKSNEVNTLNIDNSTSFEKSLIFVAVELNHEHYPRGIYAQITREINKLFSLAPTVILFKNTKNQITLSTVLRRQHKIISHKKVLVKVSLVKEIHPLNPHRAHLDILYDLTLSNCLSLIQKRNVTPNFDTLLSTLLDLLNIDKLNEKFYKELYEWFKKIVKESSFPSKILTMEEHAIRLVTRLLFIWFIKEKGLVPKELFSEECISDLILNYDHDCGDSYYRIVLQNLFFATLNTEINRREFQSNKQKDSPDPISNYYQYEAEIKDKTKLKFYFDKIPFINGGLFDCLDYFKSGSNEIQFIDSFPGNSSNKVTIPNRLFFGEDGLFPLLNSYKFTVEEKTPIEQEVALDPELLGKVFENLLATQIPETRETAQQQNGSFYTPNEIVDYMVGETLIEAIGLRVVPNDSDISFFKDRLRYLLDFEHEFDDAEELFVEEEKENIVKSIAGLKILDPAVGSGAFPMGVLHKLLLVLKRLDPSNLMWKNFHLNLASEKAKLALETKNQLSRDTQLSQIGDIFQSYSDDFGRKLFLIQNSIFGVDIEPIACQISKLRFFISLAIDQKFDQSKENFGIKPLPNLETCFVAADSLVQQQKVQKDDLFGVSKAIRELTENRENYFHASSTPEKIKFKNLDKELRNKLSEKLTHSGLNEIQANKIASWDPFDQNDKASWFDSNYMFGIEDGFDIIIGNPPYIQLQRNNGELGNRYQEMFEVFTRTGDIYCLFFERGLRLLKHDGHLCYITSNKWLRSDYGKNLRKYFTENHTPLKLIDFKGFQIFQNATVDTSILLIQNKINEHKQSLIGSSINENYNLSTNIHEHLEHNSISVRQSEGPWIICTPDEAKLIRKIEKIGVPLKEWSDISIYYGIKTGCNPAFIIDNETKEELVDKDPKSVEIIKPILRGRDIKRYHAEWAELWLIATHNGYNNLSPINIDDYPVIKEYLNQFYSKIENRQDQGITPYNLRNCAYHAQFEKEKIVYPNMTTLLPFMFDSSGMYTNQKCFIITGMNLKYLTSLLNSKVAKVWLKANCPKLGDRGMELSKVFFECIPIPRISLEDQKPFIKLVDQIIDSYAHKNSSIEHEEFIDKMVYELYQFNEKEKCLVESLT